MTSGSPGLTCFSSADTWREVVASLTPWLLWFTCLASVFGSEEESFVNKRGRVFALTLPLLLGMLLVACGNKTTTPPASTSPYNYKAPTTHGGTVVYSDWQFPDSLNIL